MHIVNFPSKCAPILCKHMYLYSLISTHFFISLTNLHCELAANSDVNKSIEKCWHVVISLTNLHWQLLDKGFYVPTQISYLTLIITQNYFWPDSDMTWYVYAYTCTQLLCIVWRTKHDFYDLKKKLSCKEKKCAHHKNCIVPN